MRYPFTEAMQKLMDTMGIPFDYMDDLTDDQTFELDDILDDYFAMHCYPDDHEAYMNGEITPEGEMVADIHTLMARTEEEENKRLAQNNDAGQGT